MVFVSPCLNESMIDLIQAKHETLNFLDVQNKQDSYIKFSKMNQDASVWINNKCFKSKVLKLDNN